MSIALAASGCGGAFLRRLASGPEARRAAAAAATAATTAATATTVQPRSIAQGPAGPRSIGGPSLRAQEFHTSAPRPSRRRRSRFRNVSAVKLGLVDEESISKFAQKHFAGFTEAEKQQLREKYTPQQLEAVELGEAAIDPRDLTIQGRLRTDKSKVGLEYLEDLSRLEPVIDKRPAKIRALGGRVIEAGAEGAEGAKAAPADNGLTGAAMPGSRFMTTDEFAQDFTEWLETFVPQDINLEGLTTAQMREVAEKYRPDDREMMEWWFDRTPLLQRDGKTRVMAAETGDSMMAPILGNKDVPGMRDRDQKEPADPEDGGMIDSAHYRELKAKTGMNVREMMNLAVKVLVSRRVHNQTRIGRVISASYLAIAGNGEGRLGIGMAKGTNFEQASARAKALAIRDMKPIRRYENRTIYGNVEAKVSGTVVQLFARPPGYGLRVPNQIFEMARAVGIQDLSARIPRSRNPMNAVKATFEALQNQIDPEEIAMGRGKKLVDARKVYYGGAVY